MFLEIVIEMLDVTILERWLNIIQYVLSTYIQCAQSDGKSVPSKDRSLVKRLEVVTSFKGKNAVNQFALKSGLVTKNWPPIIQNDDYDVGVVVSFGHMIPENIISKFPYGILNVHASLLPRWRGAAPIVYALAKGDNETGVTVMKIKPDKFDVGEILLQERIEIAQDILLPELTTMCAWRGAKALTTVLENLQHYISQGRPQPNDGVTYAPKVTAEMGRIDWSSMSSVEIYNLHRALYGIHPVFSHWNGNQVKLLEMDHWQAVDERTGIEPGYTYYDKTTKYLHTFCCDGKWLKVKQVRMAGKKAMTSESFNNGFLSKKHAFIVFRSMK